MAYGCLAAVPAWRCPIGYRAARKGEERAVGRMFLGVTELLPRELRQSELRVWHSLHHRGGASAVIRKCPRAFLLLGAVLVPVLLLVPGTSRADNDGTVRLLTAVPVPGSDANTTGGNMYVFDISWVDPKTHRYYLADRSNAAVDVVDTERGVFVKRISGGFKGFTGDNSTSGPNGVVVAFPWLFVTDAASRVVSIDLRTDKVADEATTNAGDDLRSGESIRPPARSKLNFLSISASRPDLPLGRIRICSSAAARSSIRRGTRGARRIRRPQRPSTWSWTRTRATLPRTWRVLGGPTKSCSIPATDATTPPRASIPSAPCSVSLMPTAKS